MLGNWLERIRNTGEKVKFMCRPQSTQFGHLTSLFHRWRLYNICIMAKNICWGRVEIGGFAH